MSSTPFAYPQVISRTFALFRVGKSHVSAAHSYFWDGLDSRQLHKKLLFIGINVAKSRNQHTNQHFSRMVARRRIGEWAQEATPSG